jgi:hypothetical protein
MNKFLSLLIVFAVACMATTTSSHVDTTAAATIKAKPSNIAVYSIGGGTRSVGLNSSDSLGASSGCNVYGPIALSVDNTRPQFKGFRVWAPASATTSSTGNLQVAYQLMGSNNYIDTTATWTVVDTVTPSKASGTYVDISSLPAQSIMLRVFNYGSTATVIKKKIKVIFAATATESNKAGGGF